ncbi:MAG TPA: NAD-dependent epimerase/dehydratase family protein [Steroidobacteraceae bacterium]
MIFITGANGFVGSALGGRLVRDGRRVIGAVRSPQAALPPGVETFVSGDLQSAGGSLAIPAGVSCVVHTAARVHMLDDTSSDPLAEFRRMNVDATLALARAARDAGVSRFVFVSSVKVNGEATLPGRPFRIDDPAAPLDPYGVSKCEAEVALRELARGSTLEVAVVRPPLVYGPGVRANFHALMRLLRSGLPLPFGAIDNRRSLIGIDNLVDVLTTCIDAPAAANLTFLVSDDEDVSTTELMRRLGRALGVKPRLIPVPPRLLTAGAALVGKSERMRRLCESLQVDVSATKQALGWRPRVALDQGLASTAEHYLRETRV